MTLPTGTIARQLVREATHRLVEESVPRIVRCLAELGEDEVWEPPGPTLASPGNLVLHLCGNVRQYIIATLGGQPDRRDRQQEFAERGPLPTSELLERLRCTVKEAAHVLDGLDEEALLRRYGVQGFEETGVGIVLHVVEHFSYHVGQITFYVKLRKGIDTGYYAGIDLDRRS